jgi:putative ABC transport system permease protein
LVIACINFVNLTIARSLKRAKEIGIRKVVGGERRQLIAQFLGESFTLSLCAFLFAIVLVVTLLPFFNALSNKSLSFSYLLDTKLVLIYASLFIISSLLAGFYPALVLSGFNPVESLYGRKQFAGKNYLSKSLVIVQFVLATFLIIATLTIHSQFKHLTKMDLGYNDKNLAVISPGEMNANTLAVFKDELSKKPSIKSIAARFEGKWLTRAKVYQKEIITDVEIVDENYLQVFQVAITKGRNFSAEHPSDSTKSVLINETFAKEAGWKEPIGKQLDFNGSDEKGQHYTVVGVVKDYHFDAVNELIKPQLFSCNTSLSKYGELWLKIDPVNTPQTMSFIESTFKKLTPFKPYELNFRDELNAKNYEKEAKWKQIILFSTILTIFISCIGLFGLSMLAAEKRTKEIGIRKVLGASISSMVSLLSNDFLRLVIIAAIISIPLAWWAMNKWLENYPYRIEMNAGVFVLALILVLLVALLTICFQTIKAAIANPVKSLRTE